MQADALEIESMAKCRIADEYDAAQERGEVRRKGERTSLKTKEVGVGEIGLSHNDIHEARKIRDAEAADPGLIRRTLDALLDAGEEPMNMTPRRNAGKFGGMESTPF